MEHIVVVVTVPYSTVVPMTYVVVLTETDFGAVSQVKHVVPIVAASLVLNFAMITGTASPPLDLAPQYHHLHHRLLHPHRLLLLLLLRLILLDHALKQEGIANFKVHLYAAVMPDFFSALQVMSIFIHLAEPAPVVFNPRTVNQCIVGKG
jgi:hypothetical protein